MSTPRFPLPVNQLAVQQAVLEDLPSPAPCPLPVPDPTRAFWLSPDANPLATEGSTGPITDDADVVIVGSGLTGVGAAYHLAELLKDRPTKVVILEARDFCSGATGRNGGHLTANPFHEFVERSTRHSTSAAVKAVAIEEYTVSSLLDIIAKHDLAGYVDLVQGGRITLLVSDEEFADAKRDFDAASSAGVDLSQIAWLTADEVAKTFGVPHPAIQTPGNNLWPLKLVTKLYGLAKSRSPNFSLALHTHTPATAITPSTSGPRRWAVHTPRGIVHTTHVLHATNAYASHLLPNLASAITPTRAQVIATREHGDRIGQERMEAWSANQGFEYWFPRPRQEGEESGPLIILGGGREVASPEYEFGVADDSTVNEKVGKALRSVLPGVFGGASSEWKTEQEWTGIMGFTKLGDPFVGPVLDASGNEAPYEGQFIAAGYTGHGMPRAFACAEVVSQLIAQKLTESSEEWKAPDWLPEHYLTWNRIHRVV
ncbi:hypothetical protein PLICRDRAFT_47270 [Plicaturopsis crispa FD-325 SS-3]|uniref:FAD dependent oxidoreductase domain-containing protein n=1 Tax=Plicaturopsis crispa FD-325 SS-3 TaxID=944288 RepID=A0A0C9SW00_PLICR|nr:hypothetical protein PLICRDRAFT_47270 [Plicaturopsis crispa FD-325 SS-3]